MNSELLNETETSLNSQLDNYGLQDFLDEIKRLQLVEEATQLPSYIKMFDIEENKVNKSYSDGSILEKLSSSSSPIPSTTKMNNESILSNKNNDNLKIKCLSKNASKQISNHPPFICYLHGLTEDIEILDIIMAFKRMNLKFTEIKMPSTKMLFGSIIFKEQSDLMTAIEKKIIKINDVNVSLSLSMDGTDINEDFIESIDEKPKDVIEPVQRYIPEALVPLYPPYNCFLYNLPEKTLDDEITKLFEPFRLRTIYLSRNQSNGYIEFKSRSDFISVIRNLHQGKSYKIRANQIILTPKKDYKKNYKPAVIFVEPKIIDDEPPQLQRSQYNDQQFQENNNQQLQENNDQQLNQNILSSFQNIKLIPNPPSNQYWIKVLNLPPSTPANELALFFKTISITLVRVIFLNNEICFCQFLTHHEMIMSLKLPLTTLFIFNMPIAIAPVSVEDATFLSNTQQNTTNSLNFSNLQKNNLDLKDDNNKQSTIKSVKGEIMSLAGQLAKLSKNVNGNNGNENDTMIDGMREIVKENPFRGLFKQNNVDISMVHNETTTILNNNQCEKRESSQHSNNSYVSNVSTSTVNNQRHGSRIMPWSNKLSPILIFECCKCKKQCNLTCSSCGFFYCSIQCQKNDWYFHKNRCRIPQLITSVKFHENLLKKLNINDKLSDFNKKNELHANNFGPDNVTMNKMVYPSKQMIETPMVRGHIKIPHDDIPKPGANVYISAVIDEKTLFIRSADVEDNLEYMNNLAEISKYAKFRSNQLIKHPLNGQVILASRNRNLERALVLKQKDNLLVVAFIDFGNIEMVTFDNCYDLSGNLQVLKRCVHKVTINVNRPAKLSNANSKEILNSFKGMTLTLLYEQPFGITTLVDLVNPTSGISLKNLIELFDM